MPSFGSYDAYITVDGVKLAEYAVDIQADTADGVPVVSCWIPSESGKSFAICSMNTQQPRPAVKYVIDVDGMRAGKRITRADHGPFAQATQPAAVLSDVGAAGGRRELAFADIELSDDDALLGQAVHAQLGELRVLAQPVVVTARYPAPVPETGVTLAATRVHERTKKAGVHSIGLGGASSLSEPWVVDFTNLGPPAVLFVFRYRPLALLQAQGIAPLPTPAPASLSPVLDLTRDSPDVGIKNEDGAEAADEQRILQLQEEIDTLRRRKRQRPTDDARVKAEPAARRPRLSDPHEIIDLT